MKALMERPDLYSSLEKKADTLVQTLKEVLPKAQVNQAGSLFSVFFTEHPVVDYESALKSDTGLYAKYFHYLLEHGIYTAPSQFEILFLSAAHTQEDLDETKRIMKEAAANL